jgi:hypothetical protein
MAKTGMISSRERDNKFTRVLYQSALENYLSINYTQYSKKMARNECHKK